MHSAGTMWLLNFYFKNKLSFLIYPLPGIIWILLPTVGIYNHLSNSSAIASTVEFSPPLLTLNCWVFSPENLISLHSLCCIVTPRVHLLSVIPTPHKNTASPELIRN